MVKEVGDGVDRESEIISVVSAGGRVSGRVVASVSIRRSLLARWRARFSAVAAGMVVVVENNRKWT